jgi:diguanylate cyclase (GGDEF)-like protein
MDDMMKNFALFSEFTDDELTLLLAYFITREYGKDEIVTRAGGVERKLFIVVTGSIVTAPGNAGFINRKQTVYGPGDFFGEVALCTGKSPDGDRITAEKSRLLEISEDRITALTGEHPSVAVKFVSQLLSLTVLRLRGFSRFFADIIQWGEHASRRVITDELTGVYNRLFLDDVLESFFNISKSNGKPLALFMLDLDNFRQFNETLGMDTGNAVLQAVVAIIRKSISKHGIIARYGGDEFSILLPEAGLEKALEVAEQIRADVALCDSSKYTSGKKIPVTISIGISAFPDTVQEIAEFKGKADKSLYEAKKNGRNRIEYIK